MISKKVLQLENDRLREELRKKEDRIQELKRDIYKYTQPKDVDIDLNLRYILLMNKYDKLLNSCLSKNTEFITLNDTLYGVTSIDYHKDAESVESITIKAVRVPKQNGLINDLAEPFRNVAKELNTLFFGNKED